jgi:hypothetical protein
LRLEQLRARVVADGDEQADDVQVAGGAAVKTSRRTTPDSMPVLSLTSATSLSKAKKISSAKERFSTCACTR